MLKIEKFVTASPEQWEIIIEGARNPMNSWDRMDSYATINCEECGLNTVDRVCEPSYKCMDNKYYFIGENDQKLLENLANGGPVHGKYKRMIPVWVTLTAPLYWWKEFDTYKVGTVTNSCSTMHKIHAKEFEREDFSYDHLFDFMIGDVERLPIEILDDTIGCLNMCRERYLETKDKKYWWQMIQLLPSSYNQKRTVLLNYEVLTNIYHSRKNHKLDEWHVFCDWIRELPYSELIIGEEEKLYSQSHHPVSDGSYTLKATEKTFEGIGEEECKN